MEEDIGRGGLRVEDTQNQVGWSERGCYKSEVYLATYVYGSELGFKIFNINYGGRMCILILTSIFLCLHEMDRFN